jgi:hypothetical protein
LKDGVVVDGGDDGSSDFIDRRAIFPIAKEATLSAMRRMILRFQ